MGNICCWKRKIRRKIVLLLVGLDNAGKTKAVNGLAGDPLNSPVPTVGFSVVNLKYNDYDVKVFDLGGGSNIRGIWNKYFADAHGLIFVIDSSDFSRFNEAKTVLEEMLSSNKLAGKPLLILANKQDYENAVDEIDIIEYLNIEQLVNRKQCPTLVQSCSATEKSSNKIDRGIQKGYEWLLSNITKNYDGLNTRVEKDAKEQEMKEKEELQEKIERIKNLQFKENNENIDVIETYSDYVKKMNGETESFEEDLNIVKDVVSFEELAINRLSRSSTSSSSSVTFSPVYVDRDCALPERPKSAVQIVKRQLELNNTSRRQSLKSRSNKTAPINLYGIKLPHSASERRKDFVIERRTLKSADDCLFTISNHLPNMVDRIGPGGDYKNMEEIELNNFPERKGVSSNCKRNGVPWMFRTINSDVGVNVVDVE